MFFFWSITCFYILSRQIEMCSSRFLLFHGTIEFCGNIEDLSCAKNHRAHWFQRGLDLGKGRNMSHKVRAELCYASHLSHCLNFKPHSKSSLAPRTVALVVIRLRYVGGRSHSRSQQRTDERVLVLIVKS